MPSGGPAEPESPPGVPPETLLVARAGRPHGVHGELRLMPESEDPERLLGLRNVWVMRRDAAASVAMVVASARSHQGVALVRFEGVDTPEAASALTHADVWALEADLPPRGDDEFGVAEIVGATLLDGDREVGTIASVVSGGGRDFFEVDVGGRRALVPAVKDWLISWDRTGRRISMRLPAGLLEE